MGSFGLTDIVGNTFGYSRVIVYGPDGKIKFPTGGGGGTGTVTFIGMTVPSGFSVTPASITTSGTFAITGAGTVNDYIDGTGALQVFPTIPTYTVDNGLTENPAGNFQLGGTLIQDTAIDGVGNAWQLNFTDLHSSTNTARYLYSFATNHGGSNTLLSLDSNSNVSRFSHEDGGTTIISAIELTGTELRVQTPGYATATNGDVLTLMDNTTGEAEWQTPTSGGGLPYGIASGTNNYTVTIPGVSSYTAGDAYIINFTNGNDADSDIDINGLGVKTLVKEFNIQLTGGDIVSGQELIIMYDGTNFQTLGVAPNQLFAYVTNDDSVTITKGQPVYAFGAAGNRMSVKLAYNTTDATSAQTVGVVFSTSIAPNQRGFVITQGVISGVNTAAYSPGAQLYLGATAGSLTATKPLAPNHLVYIGIVERANAGNGQIYIKPQNGYELDELHNVQAQSPTVNDVLYFFGGSPGQWKTASISTILGYTPQAQLNGTGFVVASGTTISYDNTAYAPLASPALTGTPTAPTAAVNTNTTQLATTAFVIGQIASSSVIILDSTVTPVSVVNTSTNTLVYSYLIPANFLQVGDIITILANTNSNVSGAGNAQTARYYINTSSSLTGATIVGTVTNSAGTTDFYGFSRQYYVTAIGASGNIKYYPASGSSAINYSAAVNQDITSLAIDTTVDQYLMLALQMSTTTNTCSLQTLYIEYRR